MNRKMAIAPRAGSRQRQEDAPEDAEVAAAVDARRVVQLEREGHEELAQQEDVEGAAAEERRARSAASRVLIQPRMRKMM